MEDSIHKYFQVGTIQWMSYPQGNPMESLKAICKDDFFDAIELKGYGDKNEETKRLLEQCHLKVCYGAQPRLLGGKMNYPAASCGISKVATSTYNPICYTALFSLRFYRLFYNFFPVPVLSHIYL